VIEGGYEEGSAATIQRAKDDQDAILVLDMSWEGYEKIPQVRPTQLNHSFTPTQNITMTNTRSFLLGCVE